MYWSLLLIDLFCLIIAVSCGREVSSLQTTISTLCSKLSLSCYQLPPPLHPALALKKIRKPTEMKVNQIALFQWCNDAREITNQIIFHTFLKKSSGLWTRLYMVNHTRFPNFFEGMGSCTKTTLPETHKSSIPPCNRPFNSCLFSDLGPVSRKSRKVFGPVKPFLDHLYLKTVKCIRSKLLVWREPPFIFRIRE